MQYSIGGTHTIAHAAQRVILNNGGKTFVHKPVAKVIIENGRAKGIRLEDGSEIEAKRAVVTEVSPHQFVFDLVGKEYFSPKVVKRIENLGDTFINITWYTWLTHCSP